jgi:transposase InsO family protein
VWVKIHRPGSLGWTSEQDSITIAIKLLGLRKPKAVRMPSLILLLVASIGSVLVERNDAIQNTKAIFSQTAYQNLMKQEQLQPFLKRTRAYSSHQGEITPAVPNMIERNFHAESPNEKWLTDITEFSIPAGKVYLSPIIDCFDGMPVCWRVGLSPNAELVNTMLEDAISGLKAEEHPIIHTDRGCHYRWPGWIQRMKQSHLHRSMSKKGCSLDNSACEEFLGQMKNEMFYGRSWQNVSLLSFIQIIEAYLVWYREKRMKVSLGGIAH